MTDMFENHCWQDIIPPEIIELYRPYRRDLYIGPRPALLAIDLYAIAYRGGPRPMKELAATYPDSCGIHAWDAIEPTKAVFAAARKAGIPLFHTTTDSRPEAKPTRIRATNRPIADHDVDLFEFHPDFAPLEGEVVIAKQRASAFFGTPLSSHLVQLGIDTVIVLGESTSGCVRASTVDGFSHGFHMVMAEECCFDRSDISHKINLFDLHHKYADVMHSDEVVAELSRREAGL
ncbi:isochorismatase family protein [Sphingobium fuliginis]|nr:isochorismatase family protein [Sphingobium fuliginis]